MRVYKGKRIEVFNRWIGVLQGNNFLQSHHTLKEDEILIKISGKIKKMISSDHSGAQDLPNNRDNTVNKYLR